MCGTKKLKPDVIISLSLAQGPTIRDFLSKLGKSPEAFACPGASTNEEHCFHHYRVLAWVAQWVLWKYAGVLVKIGSVGFFSCTKVQVSVKKGLNLEIEKAWLSSCFVNQEQRKPVVICIKDIRIQADVQKEGQTTPDSNASRTAETSQQENQKKFTLPKIAYYAQYIGLRIDDITVMLLNTMISDCLVHVEGQKLSLDISMVQSCYEVSMDIQGVGCRALRSVSQQEQHSEPCLAELSLGMYVHLAARQENLKQLKAIRLLIKKPQAMVKEALLTSIQKKHQHVDSPVNNEIIAATESENNPGTALQADLIPQEIGLDVTELDVKIVRQNNQRTLSVGLRTFHWEFQCNTNTTEEEQSYSHMQVEGFHTESPQAKFAELLKSSLKVTLNDNSISVQSAVRGAFFHYHHEEVQYWSSVVSRVSDTRPLQQAPQQSHSKSPPVIRQQIIEYCQRRKLEITIEMTDVSSKMSSVESTGLFLGLQSVKLKTAIKPAVPEENYGGDYLKSVSFDLHVRSISCQNMDTQVLGSNLSSRTHYWGHVFYLGTLELKGQKLGEDLLLECSALNLQLEWATNTVHTILHFLSALIWKPQASLASSQATVEATPNRLNNLSPTRINAAIKIDVSNINVFMCNNHKVGLMLRVDTVTIDHNCNQSSLILEGCKVAYIAQTYKSMVLLKSKELNSPVSHIQGLKVRYRHANKEANIQVLQTVACNWRTCHHMCVIQALEDVQDIHNRYNAYKSGRMSQTNAGARQSHMKVNVLVKAETSLTVHLSEKHSMTVSVEGFVMIKSASETLMEIENMVIYCDDQPIFNIEGMMVGTLSDCQLYQGRRSVDLITSPKNRAWNIKFDRFEVNFPYKYDFAECFEKFVNLTKWMKLVHKRQKTEFTVDSPLPPDLQIKAKVFVVQLNDDPFEVKLGDNYELMKDEYAENVKRKMVMEQKVQSLRQQHGIIPADRVMELFASLDKKSSDIYVQRSQKLYDGTPMRKKLFTWTMEDLQILALADRAFHGKENVVKHMRDIDSDSPYPEDGLEFLTLWCRYVTLNLSTWKVMMRDYPQPMLEVKDMGLFGRLIGAEQDGSRRAKRTCTVEVADPWGDTTVQRNLPALKFYHDFSCDVLSWVMANGACWEPSIAQYNSSLDLVNKPSIDPSRPLPIWDKIRLLLHGRFFMNVENMSWLYHASFDPYNTTEFMDWSWSNVILDWTNANFLLRGDLDISARTASKYDDCKLLHLPNLSLRIKLEWLCHGDPNDHHTVMPCAPDKVPDYSLEEHDSFRAFRSQNLNMDLMLDTKPLRENTLNVPSCVFYASTLRFLDKIKICLASVTRPIRRGQHFNTTKPRKPQLTRHYRTIKMSVNLHRFNICYWMSFSKQHGAELLADSFELNVCNDLILTPIEDGLQHRPSADWSVRYLNCALKGAKTWLCSARSEEEDQLNISLRNPVEKTFFLSVSRVCYEKGDITNMSSFSEDQSEKTFDKTLPTHDLQVYDLKGAWTKHNRTVLLAVLDSYGKAQSLKRNLSSDALRRFKVDGGHPTGVMNRTMSISLGPPSSPTTATPSPLTKLQTGQANSMLMKLVSESDSKSVAFTEEPSNTNMEQLHGVAACQTDDVYKKNWHIELHNSQMILKGCETSGHVIVSAAKAQILSCEHHPVWRDGQLRSKTSWVASLECMQYYATVDPGHDFSDDTMSWLPPENVEDRSEPELSGVSEMAGSGHSVGGVVYSTVGGNSKRRNSGNAIQLQRIIQRCKCQIFYANYGEVDHEAVPEIPLPPQAEDSDMISREEGVDTFTLLHHDLNVCTNSLQYTMIMDIVNNLLLHVEKKKKESTEKLQSMRFQLQLSPEENQKTPIQQLQASVREKSENLRRLEKELHLVQKEMDDNEDDPHLQAQQEQLELLLYECKEQINIQNEELSMRISCLKESQLQVKAQMKTTKAQQAKVDRRHEVCFKFAHWRLTETDGQLGIVDLVLRNFTYSKVNYDNEKWSHQLELGWVKVTNLLPNSIYKDVLVPLAKDSDNRQMALRIMCSERPPVGGIAVKDLFEVNVAPMQIQMTYQFFKTMMTFFFPDKNIETDDPGDVNDGAALSKKKLDRKASKKESVKRSSSFSSENDIDKMKERAAKNNSFLYIKVPEVSLKVSYKGEKEKNIEDVHDFSLNLPTLEYHNCIMTWFDMLMQMKNDSKRVVLSQAIKQKLHMRARVGEETPLTDVQQEEDKMKMLLGAKLLAGQEKPTKKSLFGKSQKQ